MTGAVGYIRRSKEAGARTVSLEDQRERITFYCKEHGWQLAEVLVDDGVSGGRRERLVRLDATLRATAAKIVVVYHLDRLARDAAGLLDWIDRAGRRGVELHVVGRGRIETQTASGYLVAGVEGIVAAHYRKVISEKTRDALARLRAKGRRTSRWAPYGFRHGPEGRLLTDRREQATLARIAALHAAGATLRGISVALAADGVVARNGKPLAPWTIARIAARVGAASSVTHGA